MIYKRQFWVQAVHFNGALAYEKYFQALEDEKHGRWLDGYRNLKHCLGDVHGHNFLIEIEAKGPLEALDSGPEGWGTASFLVDDFELEKVIQEWGNKNLSILPEFVEKKLRATTEAMAEILGIKLANKWPHLKFKITIHETNMISVQHEV